MQKTAVIKKSASVPTFLVSNGISYLGLNLCQVLLEKGARVVVLDFVTDEVRNRAKTLLQNPNFALFHTDPNSGIPNNIQSVDYVLQLMYPDNPEDFAYSQDDSLKNKDLVAKAFATKYLLDLAVSSNAKFALVEACFMALPNKKNSEKSTESGSWSLESLGYSYTKNSDFLRSLVWDYVSKKKLDGRIIRLGPIFGPGMCLDSAEGLCGFLNSICSGKPLKIYDDSAKVPYLYILDAVDGIIKALLQKKTAGRIFRLVGEGLYTDLELAFVLRGISDADLKMEYVDTPKSFVLQVDSSLGEQVPRWTPSTDIKTGLKKTLESLGCSPNPHSFKPAKLIDEKLAPKVSPIPKTQEKPKIQKDPKSEYLLTLAENEDFDEREVKPKTKPQIKFKVKFKANSKKAFVSKIILMGSFVLFLATAIAPLLITLISSSKALSSLEKVSLNMSQLQTDSSRNYANKAFSNVLRAGNSFGRLHWIFRILGKEEIYYSLDSVIESSVYFTGALYRTSKALDPFSSVWEVVKPTTDLVFSAKEFETSSQELLYARRSMDMALASLSRVPRENLPDFLNSKISFYNQILTQYDSLLKDSSVIAGSLPNVLGLRKEQNYLILLQNPHEIRPTGGFIGSYALLTLENGKIKNLTIDDIYNPDGQIDTRQIISPVPAPIKKFLSENILHIRNANWSPDFPKSAESIEELFFKLDGSSFDGVVALDLNTIQSLLKVTGPVFLAAYNEEINADNLYERTQYHAEFDYQEGISEKRSFLTILSGKLLEKIFALLSQDFSKFILAISDSLNSRSLQIYLKDPLLASFLTQKKWDGKLVDTQGDFLMIVNSNLGGTKANYFVKNNYEYSVSSDTRDGLLRSNLALNFSHNGENNAWPGGPYTDYVRVYTPLGSKITGARLMRNGDSATDIIKQVESSVELNKSVFAFSFVLNPQEEIGIEITYDLPENLSLVKKVPSSGESSSLADYSLYWQKQAGTREDTFRFNFRGPFGTEIATYKPAELIKEKNLAILEGKLERDQEIELLLK